MRDNPTPCERCGVLIVTEFGKLDAGDYANGVISRHWCEVACPEPPNERDFCPLCYGLVRRGRMIPHRAKEHDMAIGTCGRCRRKNTEIQPSVAGDIKSPWICAWCHHGGPKREKTPPQEETSKPIQAGVTGFRIDV